LTQVANVFQVKSSSNVVTEYVRSKKLIKYPRVAMTANSSGGHVASASSENNGTTSGQAWRAFDGNAGGERGYHSAAATYSTGVYIGTASVTDVNNKGYDGEWIKLQLPTGERIKVMGAYFYPRTVGNTEYPKRTPYKGYILGSNTGSNGSWNLIASFDGIISSIGNPGMYMFQNNTNDYYNHIALVANEVYPDGIGEVLNFAELEYYGVPEYDPDAHGTDVIARSIPNVPNTDWLEVYYDGQDYTSMPSTITDKSGNSVTGTPTNVTFDSTWKAFSFDGSFDYISATIGTTTGAWVHSSAFWVYVSEAATNGVAHFVAFGNESANNASVIRMNGFDVIRWYFWGCDLSFEADEFRGRWTHVVGVYDGGNNWGSRRVFVNGIERRITETSGTEGGLNLLSTSVPLRIGSQLNNTQHLNGKIANLRLFNRALTGDEIWQLYAYQKDYFQVSPDVVTFKGGRMGVGTENPKAVLDVRGTAMIDRTYTLVDNIVAQYVVPSNSEFVHIPNLDLDGDGGTYKIVINMKNATNSNPGMSMYINDVSTSASYYSKRTQHATTTGALSTGNSEYLFNLGGTSQHYHEFILTRHTDTGYPMCMGTGMFHTGTAKLTYSIQGWDLHAWLYFDNTNVTKLSFQTYPHNAIASGSIFTIYKYL